MESVDITTGNLPQDRYVGAKVKSNSKPEGDVLNDIKSAYAGGVGVSTRMIKVKKVAKVSSRRLLDTYEITMQIMADPSGKITVTPDVVVNEKNSKSCTACFDRYNELFK